MFDKLLKDLYRQWRNSPEGRESDRLRQIVRWADGEDFGEKMVAPLEPMRQRGALSGNGSAAQAVPAKEGRVDEHKRRITKAKHYALLKSLDAGGLAKQLGVSRTTWFTYQGQIFAGKKSIAPTTKAEIDRRIDALQVSD